MHAHAALLARETGSVEKLFGASGIVPIPRDGRFGGPMIRGQRTGGDLGLPVEEIADEGFKVRGKTEGLTKLAAGQESIFKVEAKIIEIRSGSIGDLQIGLARENGNTVRREGTHFDVSGAFAEFECANYGVRDDPEADASEVRGTAEESRIAFDDDFFILRLLNEAKGAGADRMVGKIGAGLGGNDADRRTNQIDGERRIGLAEMEYYRDVIGRLDRSDQPKGPALGRLVGWIQDEVEGGFHVRGSERAAIVEAHSAPKVENVGKRIADVPGFGEVAVEVHPIIALQEAAEQESVDALGLRIGGETRVEIGGAGFDEKRQGRGISVR